MIVDHLSDDELATLLVDVGRHLELGDATVTLPVASGRADRAHRAHRAHRSRRRRLLVAAAMLVVAVALTLAVAPAREAVARWLGIGAVELRTGSADSPTPAGGSTGRTTSPGPAGPLDVDALERSLPFDVRLLDPTLAGAPLGAAVDERVATGLVEVRYGDVTLVQIASLPGEPAVVGKTLRPGTEVAPVGVRGRPGFWISGSPHELAYLAPDGSFATDTVRRAGDVLLWEEDGVTYRIEGAPSLDRALALAASLR